ncbi:hypothetical protein CA13_61120 [Planctomycetes bacterium CA13]|uniref:Uncharacterized protein n=1 Tax=Novipirellula herctigrandis TaxID=2527986 RepID=A0A5C5ZBG9_9BACT|nr:hypothetical protein CA13_61120 [Planctomycetes bacterium CA13]
MRIPFEIMDGTAESDDPFSWDEAINIKAPEQKAVGSLRSCHWSQTFNGVVASVGDSKHADGMAAERAIEILDQVKDKPFFLVVGIRETARASCRTEIVFRPLQSRGNGSATCAGE